jgi:hypothetical protein
LAVAALIAAIGIGASIADDRHGSGQVTRQGASKYDQTWSKSYSETSCAEWTGSLTARQRFAAAADMLSAARNKGDGGTGLPPEELIDRFADDVTQGCSGEATAATQTVAQTGALIYLTGRELYRP